MKCFVVTKNIIIITLFYILVFEAPLEVNGRRVHGDTRCSGISFWWKWWKMFGEGIQVLILKGNKDIVTAEYISALQWLNVTGFSLNVSSRKWIVNDAISMESFLVSSGKCLDGFTSLMCEEWVHLLQLRVKVWSNNLMSEGDSVSAFLLKFLSNYYKQNRLCMHLIERLKNKPLNPTNYLPVSINPTFPQRILLPLIDTRSRKECRC